MSIKYIKLEIKKDSKEDGMNVCFCLGLCYRLQHWRMVWDIFMFFAWWV